MDWSIQNMVDIEKSSICWGNVLAEAPMIIEMCGMRDDPIEKIQKEMEGLCKKWTSTDKRKWFSYEVVLDEINQEVRMVNNMGAEDVVMFIIKKTK